MSAFGNPAGGNGRKFEKSNKFKFTQKFCPNPLKYLVEW